jgi:hypothetical protein
VKHSERHARRIADFLIEEGELLLQVKPLQTPREILKVQDIKRSVSVMLLDYESAKTSEMIADMPD